MACKYVYIYIYAVVNIYIYTYDGCEALLRYAHPKGGKYDGI